MYEEHRNQNQGDDQNINGAVNRRSHYNRNRDSYFSKDGKDYLYTEHGTGRLIQRVTIEDEGVDEDLMDRLDDEDHNIDLQDRYDTENRDYDFENEKAKFQKDPDKYAADPVDNIPAPGADPLDILIKKEEEEEKEKNPTPEMKALLAAIAQLTPAQRDLIYDYLGQCRTLEEIRQEEIERTGREFTQQAMSNRWRKIIVRICTIMEVPVPRTRRTKED